MSTIPKLLTAQALSQQLGVPLWTVRTLAKRGAPHLRLGNKLFFDSDAIAEWIAREAARAAERQQKNEEER